MSLSKAFVIGLTGGIGSGKSAVAEAFASLGIDIVDTDAIAHELTAAHGKAMPDIVAAFGSTVQRPDGALDRDAMRALVFSDAVARKRLESILHPLIRRLSKQRCERAHSPYVILAVPLLVESGAYSEICQRICVVDCATESQIERVAKRSGLSRAQVSAIMAAQATREQRLAAADDVIDNSGSLTQLMDRVKALDHYYRGLAASARSPT